MSRPWQPSDDELLRRAWNAGYWRGDIAARLKRLVGEVEVRALALGLDMGRTVLRGLDKGAGDAGR